MPEIWIREEEDAEVDARVDVVHEMLPRVVLLVNNVELVNVNENDKFEFECMFISLFVVSQISLPA